MANVFLCLSGGIGNQLFQLATGVSYAKQTSSELICFLGEKDHYNRRFRLGGLLQELRISLVGYSDVPRRPVLNDIRFYQPEIAFAENLLRKDVVLRGSFQQWLYFYKDLDSFRDNVLTWLRRHMEDSAIIPDGEIESLIHLRLGHCMTDQLKPVNNATPLPAEVVSTMIRKTASCHKNKLCFISDHPTSDHNQTDYLSQLREYTPALDLVAVGSHSDPIHDLHLMSTTKDLLILSNSTFSVWGSILNTTAKVHGVYLNHIEKWASNMPHVYQHYFDPMAYNFKTHLGDHLAPVVRADSVTMRGCLWMLSRIDVSVVRRLHHGIERYLGKRMLA